jgi:hypothetical protein
MGIVEEAEELAGTDGVDVHLILFNRHFYKWKRRL